MHWRFVIEDGELRPLSEIKKSVEKHQKRIEERKAKRKGRDEKKRGRSS